MKRTIILLTVTLMIIGIAAVVTAHDYWLLPQKFMIQPGETIIISGNTGMDFPGSLSAVAPERVTQFFMVGKDKKVDLAKLVVKDKSLTTTCTFEKPGTYVVGTALKPKEIRMTGEEFNEYLEHDGISSILELRKKEGILDKDAVEFYSKYPKAIIQAGDSLDDTPTKPVGLIIEIVPKVNPYTLKKGDELKVTVLFRGKPLPGVDLAWSHPGLGGKFAGWTKTDQKGDAVVPLIKRGPYMIRLTHMEWVKKQTHEWESFWTALTFEVKAD
ncbi:DUF4198 domain-containing protein [Acidobacteriota bacterium]